MRILMRRGGGRGIWKGGWRRKCCGDGLGEGSRMRRVDDNRLGIDCKLVQIHDQAHDILRSSSSACLPSSESVSASFSLPPGYKT